MKPKKSVKTEKYGPEYDSRREQNVLLEAIHKDVKTIAEGHSILNRKLDEANDKLDDHGRRLDRVEIEIIAVKTDVATLKTDVATLKTATMENSQRIKNLEDGQEELKAGQERIEQKFDTVIVDINQRVTRLEAVR